MYNLVIFASGNGSTLQAIIDNIENGKLSASIQLVVSDNSNAYALERAKKHNIPTYVIKSKTFEERDNELSEVLSNVPINLIVLAGYLKMIGPKLIDKYTLINTHPSLLPKYGGKGMHGLHVHQAVVNSGDPISGVTVHFVNSEYDKGSIIRQVQVPVKTGDTAESLSQRVQIAEKIQLVEVLDDFINGKIS